MAQLLELNTVLQACRDCPLFQTRQQAILGSGSPDAKMLIVLDAPGSAEDQVGKPFAGKTGLLLVKMLARVGLAQTDVFITNVCRCRTPANRAPYPSEILACSKHLKTTISIIEPSVIMAFGRNSAQALSSLNIGVDELRTYINLAYVPYPDAAPEKRIPIVCTHPPGYILRHPKQLSEVLNDLQRAMTYGNITPFSG